MQNYVLGKAQNKNHTCTKSLFSEPCTVLEKLNQYTIKDITKKNIDYKNVNTNREFV